MWLYYIFYLVKHYLNKSWGPQNVWIETKDYLFNSLPKIYLLKMIYRLYALTGKVDQLYLIILFISEMK